MRKEKESWEMNVGKKKTKRKEKIKTSDKELKSGWGSEFLDNRREEEGNKDNNNDTEILQLYILSWHNQFIHRKIAKKNEGKNQKVII